MFKKIILPIMALLACAVAQAQNILNVNLSNGETVSIPFEDLPVVTYPTDGSMSIHSASTDVTYEFSDVLNFSYSSASNPTGLDAVKADIQTRNGIMSINGLKAGDAVIVYTLTGQQLSTVTADASGTVIVDLTNARQATLIVKTPSTSFKVNTAY